MNTPLPPWAILVIRLSERPIWIGWPKKVIPLTTPTATARYPCLLDDLPKWHRSSGRPPARSPNERRGSNSHVTECGPGNHAHSAYDRQVTDLALDFLKQETTSASKQPFLLYCGYMHPHFPLIAPAEFLADYDPNTLELPSTWNCPLDYQHPVIQHLRWAW